MADQSLHLDAVTLHLADREILALNTRVAPGEILTVMGPSGSGKSTLLSFLSGTLDPAFTASGRVTLAGADITTAKPEVRRIGILFQDALLFPHLSVAENLAFGMPRNTTDRTVRIQVALADVGLGTYTDADPATLSGGQKARVALMRVLLSEPRALLLDEPFSKLDTDLRAQTRSLVFDHARAAGLPTIMVTHDAEDAAAANGPIHRLS